jgi:hypothetical protein
MYILQSVQDGTTKRHCVNCRVYLASNKINLTECERKERGKKLLLPASKVSILRTAKNLT